jgi:hypothetical protein
MGSCRSSGLAARLLPAIPCEHPFYPASYPNRQGLPRYQTAERSVVRVVTDFLSIRVVMRADALDAGAICTVGDPHFPRCAT